MSITPSTFNRFLNLRFVRFMCVYSRYLYTPCIQSKKKSLQRLVAMVKTKTVH
ncbi:hypothetical protein Hanom_Chr10g00921121 [Helianthus anomalus]